MTEKKEIMVITPPFFMEMDRQGRLNEIPRESVIALKNHIIYWIENKIPNEWWSKKEQRDQLVRYNRILEVMRQNGF